MYGNCAPSLSAIAVRILSQTSSSSACEINWSTFVLIHTKQRNRLAYFKLEQLVYCYYNMKLKLRDMAAEKDKVNETDFMDLLQVAAEAGDDKRILFLTRLDLPPWMMTREILIHILLRMLEKWE